ncbi:RNA polymerase sigma factor [Paenibacillus ottowii]|uniref:RNA polymerase sigma factor n=1 Tax=Paenibacillus ottowii TaxID=2315729 RepID=A0ABY3B6G5_9BACL|nr:RNA polymerase sigma factor [Paenibacillus ottowii]TQR97049.1 RNA polymerase sigma factor [Paenibacillus ottowii]
MDNEQLWMQQCRDGDKDAFYQLVKPYLDRVYSTSVAILHSTHLAEDAVQNAMIEAYRAIMNGKEIRSFGSWFKQIAAMRAMDLARLRSKQTKRTGHLDNTELIDSKDLPIDAVMKKESGHRLLSQVMSLDTRHRSVIVLYYYQEMSVEEISEVLGVKEGTVKSRLHTARMKLLKLNQNINPKKVIFDV